MKILKKLSYFEIILKLLKIFLHHIKTNIYLCRLSFLLFIRFISNCTVHRTLQFLFFNRRHLTKKD